MEELDETVDATETNEENDKKKNDDENAFCKPALPPPPPSQSSTKSIKNNINQQHQQTQKCDYLEPPWSAVPNENDNYFLECIKNGTKLENIDLNKKSFYSIGRYYTCDLMLEHPSLSRFHAILQYSNGELDVNYPKGFYLYDLNSTHGTILNKKKLDAKIYVFVKIGSCIKFGGSTRLYILNGPELPNADDLNINLTHEQMKIIREKQNKLALKLRIQKEVAEEQENVSKADEGIDWGINNDEVEAPEAKTGDAAALNNITFNADQTNDDTFYASDPRKALKIFFEREGEDLNYDIDELGHSRFKCSIRLPIDNDFGEAIYAEVANFDGKKKDCMAQCALEACRILDSVGILRQSNSEYKRKRIEKDWQSNDYYDSDEDTYLDRTGDIEKKRMKRIDKFGATENVDKNNGQKIMTFDTLRQEFRNLNDELIDINMKLEKCKNIVNAVQSDDVDAYIHYLKIRDNNKLDTITRMKLKRRVIDINQELIKLDKLLNLAKPGCFDLNKWKIELVDEIKNSKLAKNTESVKEEKVKVEAPVSIPFVKEPKVSDELKKPKIESEIVVEKKPVEKKFISLPPKKKEFIENDTNGESSDEIKSYNDLKTDKDYSIWLPPEDQSGDGKTKLNAKYGY